MLLSTVLFNRRNRQSAQVNEEYLEKNRGRRAPSDDWSVKGIAYGLLLIVTLSVAGSVSAADHPNDARYKKDILGNWQEQNVLETGVTLQKQFAFTPDGKFWVSVKRTEGSTISSYRTEGTWTIENEALTINIVNSTNPNIRAGQRSINKIIRLTEKKLVSADRRGNITTAYRVNP